jgi:hypothetical protein
MLLPLAARVAGIRRVQGAGVALGYFVLIGVGFMLLEIGFLQKLILYLAHPIYAAAVAISAFLVFGGVGSSLSARWRVPPRRVAGAAGAGVVIVAAFYLAGLDGWLRLSQGWGVWLRFAVAAATIAPLALAMGHMFPCALRQLGATAPQLVPLAWGLNGFASVMATVAAPLLAMHMGFARLTLVAMACYALAALAASRLPGETGRAEEGS